MQVNVGKRDVRVREAFIQLDGFKRRCPCLWEGFFGSSVTIARDSSIAACQSRVGRCIVRVGLDSLLEILQSFFVPLAGSLVPVIEPLEIGVMRLGIEGWRACEERLLLSRELDSDLLGYGARHFSLQRQHVA